MKDQIVYNENGKPVGVVTKGNYLPLLTDEVVSSITETISDSARQLGESLLKKIFGATTVVMTPHSSWVAGFQYVQQDDALYVFTKRNKSDLIDLDVYFILEDVEWFEVSLLIETALNGLSVGSLINRMKNNRK